jgi:hypothetical protein
MPSSGEEHRYSRSLCRRDYFLIANAATRLNNSHNTTINQNL